MGAPGGAAGFPRRGWWGIGLIALAIAAGRFGGAEASSAAAILAWWGLALALDAAAARSGPTLFEAAPDVFVWLAVLSIFLGVGLEWAAGRLGVWAYLGLPSNELVRYAALGAELAAFLPALHSAAGAFGANVEAPRRSIPSRAAMLGLFFGAGLAAAPFALPSLAGLPGFAAALAGVWLSCDSLNALRERPSLLAGPLRQLLVWAAAGLALVAATAAIGALSGQGRFPAGFESPALYHYLLLAPLGPALRAASLTLADSLGLPTWPGRENLHALIR